MAEAVSIRSYTVQGIFVLVGLVMLTRLFYMQVMDTSYQDRARANVVREVLNYPSRGLIFDRNHNLVVNNEPVYDLMYIPSKVSSLDTNKLCKLLSISKAELDSSLAHVKNVPAWYSEYKPQVLLKQIPADVYARLQEYLYQFPGFYPQVRTIRQYHYPYAGHILGYISEVNKKQIDTSDYYRMGDYAGVSGIERSYEETLRGERGVKYIAVDVNNREIGSYKSGSLDKEAVAGKNLMLTIDMDLQGYAEDIMQNKKGSVVAIEPSTGEILCLVSSPGYDPTLLSGNQIGKGMAKLSSDKLRQPLFNRALSAAYPPGSTFKPLMALLALQEGYVSPNYYYPCERAYKLGSRRVKCHYHRPCYNVQTAIEESCNAYFCHLFKVFIYQDKFPSLAKGLTSWHNLLTEWGLGTGMNLDLPIGRIGQVPSPDTYNKKYGRNRWGGGSIISLGIGQGEMGFTPLQMAQIMAIIANKGTFYYPHIVRHDPNARDDIYNQQQRVSIESRHFRPVIEGLARVITHGTAKKAYTPGIEICGKTGTAQNPHGGDHSMFIGFAPRNNPQIAIAVVVENAGKGGDYAAPIGSLVIEKYLRGEVTRQRLESRMRNKYLLNTYRQRRSSGEWGTDSQDSSYNFTPYSPPLAGTSIYTPNSATTTNVSIGENETQDGGTAAGRRIESMPILETKPTSIGGPAGDPSGGNEPKNNSGDSPPSSKSPANTTPANNEKTSPDNN